MTGVFNGSDSLLPQKSEVQSVLAGDKYLEKVVHIYRVEFDFPGSRSYICVSHGQFATCVPQKKGAKKCLLTENHLGFPINCYRGPS